MNGESMHRPGQKEVIYQVFTRLFGNTNTNNKPWGTLQENGVGKFADFTTTALEEIAGMGVSCIWYTGVLHHALVTDYTSYGISADDPDVVKGRAGSPYAIKDYYNVNPDLALDPLNRLDEFRELVERTHKAGMKVMIDLVPNHLARFYEGASTPPGQQAFGKNDNTQVSYDRDNNFYYIPGQAFRVPQGPDGYKPLGGEIHPLSDGKFHEFPAKWTGNGSRSAAPGFDDWYETVKVNYGISPDGEYHFDRLPAEMDRADHEEHFRFWKGRDVPDSWKKFRHIARYWLDFGIDGFRYDMAEMVPVEFWSYLNSGIKKLKPNSILMAEVYNPGLYRDYIHQGRMDYLYDKVGFYDGLKHIIKGYGWTDHIPVVQQEVQDIEHHMLHFLENHDEERIASPAFAGNPFKALPAMVSSATISTSPLMLYFGQEVGEKAMEAAGFGQPSRTSIFDYIGVPAHQRWMNGGAFDGGALSPGESRLRDYYKRLLLFTRNSPALMGAYRDIHYYNRDHTENYNHRVLSFARWCETQKLVIVCNFDSEVSHSFQLQLPAEIISAWELGDGEFELLDKLSGAMLNMSVADGIGQLGVQLNPLESLILELQ